MLKSKMHSTRHFSVGKKLTMQSNYALILAFYLTINI